MYSEGTVGEVARSHSEVSRAGRCPRCGATPTLPANQECYAYVLGLYLGDGYLVMTARVPVLRITCDTSYPGLIEAGERALLAVLARRVQRVRKVGCVNLQSYSKHWPCLLPQHGPGKKHDRPIVLEPWQREVVEAQPGAFVRGLFHSDGCRIENRVHRNGRSYAYPRYMFTNKSTDIMGLCQWGLDLLGVAWRMARPDSLSVARRESVAILDRWVGPKH